MYVHIHIYRMYYTDACSLTHSLPTTAIGPARPRTPLPPSLPPSLPPHTQPHIPRPPYIPTGEYHTPQRDIQPTTQQPCPGTAGPNNDPGATPPCTYLCTYIAYASLTLVALPTAHARRILARQDLRLPLPPCRLPRCSHTSVGAFSKSSSHPEVSTISYNTPFSLQQLITQRRYPGSAGSHNGPWSDSSVYVRMCIYRVCFTDICSLTHSSRTTAIGFAQTSSSSLPPFLAAPTRPNIHSQSSLHPQR